jgi:hypothetical protein
MPQGIQSHGDVLVNKLSDGTDLNEIWNELTDVLKVYNEHRSAIASLLSYRTFSFLAPPRLLVEGLRFGPES